MHEYLGNAVESEFSLSVLHSTLVLHKQNTHIVRNKLNLSAKTEKFRLIANFNFWIDRKTTGINK